MGWGFGTSTPFDFGTLKPIIFSCSDLTMEDKGAVKGAQTNLLCKVFEITQEITAEGWVRGGYFKVRNDLCISHNSFI